MKRIQTRFWLGQAVCVLLATFLFLGSFAQAQTPLPENPQTDSVGIQGKISAPPPATGATISIPNNGQAFTTLPVTVSGLCPNNTLVKLFKNNVFSGSAQCDNGSFSIVIDLFNGQNELIARVYDSLDQVGPDSNVVNVSYSDDRRGSGARVSLTSNFAKRGANPGESLTWPIVISGGEGPYAISVDWGDGKTPDLLSQQFPGTFNVQHIFDSPGVYNIVIKATDKNGVSAYLQLVGVANGPLSQESGNGSAGTGNNSGSNVNTQAPKVRIVWQPAAILVPFLMSTFWLGKRYELHVLRKRIERGIHPFQ